MSKKTSKGKEMELCVSLAEVRQSVGGVERELSLG